jgi:hypothetical protein
VAATDKQVKIMFKEMSKNNNLSKAAAKADMCRQTAGKYYHENKLPSQLKKARDWQTRTCPFADVWPEIEDLLRSCPGLNGISILNVLNDKYDNRYTDNQLRTLQRKIRRWRALHDKNENYEVFFQQIHRPGEMAQTDFTETASLGLTILGNPYKYLLCQTGVTLLRLESCNFLPLGIDVVSAGRYPRVVLSPWQGSYISSNR